MAYDEKLAERVRRAVASQRSITERRMFGGLAFMLHGNMFVGVESDRLMIRVGPAKYDEALKKPRPKEMDFTGRPLRGYVFVERDGFATAPALRAWIDRAIDFAKTLPAKGYSLMRARPRAARE